MMNRNQLKNSSFSNFVIESRKNYDKSVRGKKFDKRHPGPYMTEEKMNKNFRRWIAHAGTASIKLVEGAVSMTPFDNVLYFPKNVDLRLCTKNAMTKMKQFFRLTGDPESLMGTTLGSRLTEVSTYTSVTHPPFRLNSHRICIKRDPVERFVSACAHYKHLYQLRKSSFESVDSAKKYGMTFDPLHLDEFSDMLDAVKDNKFADDLFFPQFYYLGLPEDYDEIYYMSEVPDLIEYLSDWFWDKTDAPIEFDGRTPNTKGNVGDDRSGGNASSKDFKLAELNPRQVDSIKQIYAEDYRRGWM